MANYGDILLEAVQTVVDGSLSKLAFDKTITATITSNANAKKGEYTVNDGSTSFLAYSENTEYSNGTAVYINIPNGDFTKQKTITGKYLAAASDYYTYSSPWNKYVDITGNLLPEDTLLSITANGSEKTTTTQELTQYKISDAKEYDCIGLRVNFKTLLNSVGTEIGTYGLRLYIRTINKVNSSTVNPYKTYVAELSTLDMIGNPYNFESYYSQEKVFDISGMGEIYSISIALFQNGDFCDGTGKLIPVDSLYNQEIKNIFANNIYISLGYNLETFSGNQAWLYSLDSETYDSSYGRTGEENQKTLKLRWVHEDSDGNIVCYTDMSRIGESARIHWYKYKLDSNISDELAGAFWEEIPEWQDSFENSINCFDYVAEQNVQYKVIIETPVKEYLLRDSIQDQSLNTAISLLEQARFELDNALTDYENAPSEFTFSAKEEAQVLYDNRLDEYNTLIEAYTAEVSLLESNILMFSNEREVENLATLDLIQALTLDVDSTGYRGIYTLYDETNNIQNPKEANIIRTITANYKSTVTGDTDLDSAESIMWQFPLTNTMIHAPELGKEIDDTDEVTYTDDGQYCIITRNAEKVAGTIGKSFEHATEQYFRIKDYYMASATNNTITCYVTKNQKVYQAVANLSFGPLGNNGTDFTFIMRMESGRTCLYGTDNDPLEINVSLYDFNNDEVPHAQNATINYSWWAQDDITKIGFCTANGTLIDSDGNEVENTEDLTGIKLLRKYAPTPDSNDSHMSCWIRRLTNEEIRTLNGLSTIDKDTDIIPFFYIMEASIKIDALSTTKNLGKVILNSYLPIPYGANYQYTQIEGADKIVYNSAGTGRTYYENNYVLYCGNEPIEDTIWKEANGAQTIEELKFYPVVEDDGKLIPSSTYVMTLDKNDQQNEHGRQVAAVAYADLGDKKKGDIRWTQPIAILQNAYSSAMLNAWDGGLTIDEDNGTIMSAMVGAGYKDEHNRFNGILMGDIKSKVDTAAETGIFGYGEGVQSFGFKTDGTAFLGKSGKGQIQFNGTSGIIQSMSYTKGRTGMKIDLDDGVIEMRGNEIETVENVKNVDTITVTDFTTDLNDIYYYIDDKKNKASNNQELYNAMLTLQNCNGKNIKDMTEAEIFNAEVALNYIRKTVDAVEFKSDNLDKYLADKRIEYQKHITDLQNSIKLNTQSISNLKDTTADQEDKEKLIKSNNENEEEILKYEQLIKELDNYKNVSADIEQYKVISALEQQKLDISNQYSAAKDKVNNLTEEIEKETEKKKNISDKRDAAQGDYEKYEVSTTTSSEAENILNAKATKDTKNILYNEYLDLKNEVDASSALLSDLEAQRAEIINKQIDLFTTQLEQLKTEIAKEEKKLVIQENYEAIIDTTDILAAYDGDSTSDAYKQAVKEAYFELLSSTDKTSILPTQLVNSTTTIPTYKKTKAQVRLATVSPYLQLVDSKGYNLLEASDQRYHLQSSGYKDSINVDGSGGKGVKFDLLKGKLTGYNFSFKSALSSFADEDLDANKYNGSYVSLSSLGTDADPFFRVHYAIPEENINIKLLDITRSNFVMHSQDWNGSDSGLELNLTKGKLKAFSGFDLRAGNNDTYIRLSDSGSPYFQIVQESKKLMNITTKSFVLQSLNWVEGSAGMQIDLTKGRIKSFSDFDLKTTITSGTYADSYIRLGTSTSAFAFIINYKNKNNNGLKILEITHDKFKMHSHDWNSGRSGVRFDMEKGKIDAYSFTIKAYRALNTIDTNQYIAIDSTNGDYPLAVRGEEKLKDGTTRSRRFLVGWDGKATLDYLNADEGEIGPFNFTTQKMYTESASYKGSGIYMDKSGNASFNGKTYIGSHLDVSGNTTIDGNAEIKANTTIDGILIVNKKTYLNGDLEIAGSIKGVNWGTDGGSASGVTSKGGGGVLSAGNVNAQGGYIGGWKISDPVLQDDSGTIILDPSKKEIDIGSHLKISSSKLYFDSSYKLGNDTSYLSFNGDYLYITGDTWINGEHVAIGSAKYTGALCTIGGKTYITGNVGINGYPDDTYGLNLGGKFNVKGQIFVDGASTVGYDSDTTIEIDTPWSTKVGKLTFRNGLLMGYENVSASGSSAASYVLNDNSHKRGGTAGKLAYLNEVVIKSANFKIGSSSTASSITTALSGVGSPTVSGDTATYIVKIPGQSYSTTSDGGSVSYSGTVGFYIYTDSTGKYKGWGTNRSSTSGISSTYQSISYSGSKSYGGQTKQGTTSARYMKATITVKAQA